MKDTKIGYTTNISAQLHVELNNNKKGSSARGADNSTQVQEFVLLTHILKKAGLTTDDVKSCLIKYIETLSHENLNLLMVHLPHVKDLCNDWQPTTEGIAQLGRHRSMPALVVSQALRNAKLRFVEQPAWGHGEKGWLREMLHVLARDAAASHQSVKENAWFDNPDCALWLAIMARLRIVLSDSHKYSNSMWASVQESYRDGWLGVFGVETQEATQKSAWSTVVRTAPKKTKTNSPVATPKKRGGFNRNDPQFPVRGITFATIDKRLRNPKPRPSTPASEPTPVSEPTPKPEVNLPPRPSPPTVTPTPKGATLLSPEFFSLQTHNRMYLSLLKELPSLASQTARNMRRLPGMAKAKSNKPVHEKKE